MNKDLDRLILVGVATLAATWFLAGLVVGKARFGQPSIQQAQGSGGQPGHDVRIFAGDGALGQGRSKPPSQTIVSASLVSTPDQTVPGRPDRQSRLMSKRMRVTAYCPCPQCCGRWSDGFTASGLPVTANGGRFVAADPKVLPVGSQVRVPGYNDGKPVPVLDTGSAIVGDRLDVFFPTHDEAVAWGVRWLDVDLPAGRQGVR